MPDPVKPEIDPVKPKADPVKPENIMIDEKLIAPLPPRCGTSEGGSKAESPLREAQAAPGKCAKLNAAVRKKARKVRMAAKKEDLRAEEQAMKDAQSVYEQFHEFPDGCSSTPEQIINSSAGLSGWQKVSLPTPVISTESIRGSLPGAEEGSRTALYDQHASEAKSKPKLCDQGGCCAISRKPKKGLNLVGD